MSSTTTIALDKVLLGRHLPLDGTSSLTSSRISAAYDLASLILFGTTALPVKLKILLDALLSSFNEAERAQLLQGFGWTLQDFSRGYIHKVSQSLLHYMTVDLLFCTQISRVFSSLVNAKTSSRNSGFSPLLPCNYVVSYPLPAWSRY